MYPGGYVYPGEYVRPKVAQAAVFASFFMYPPGYRIALASRLENADYGRAKSPPALAIVEDWT